MTESEMLESIYDAVTTRNGEMADIKSKLNVISKFGEEIVQLKCLIIGDGTSTHVGIANEVRVIQKWIDARVWFERILIAAIVCEFVALVFLVVKVVLKAV